MSAHKTPHDCFIELKSLIHTVSVTSRIVTGMPYEEFMQESRRVVALVEKYYERLKVSDIDPYLLETIAVRAGAFAYCIAALESHVETTETNRTRYAELKKEGYALRRKLLADYEYIFRSSDRMRAAFSTIRDGRGHLEMFKDLLSLYKISIDHGKRLTEAHFDNGLAEKAHSLYTELINLSATIDIDPKKISDGKLLVRKAGILLWNAMKEIYAAGRYVFCDEPEIKELFYVDYYQKVAKKREYKSNGSQQGEPEPESVDPSAATVE